MQDSEKCQSLERIYIVTWTVYLSCCLVRHEMNLYSRLTSVEHEACFAVTIRKSIVNTNNWYKYIKYAMNKIPPIILFHSHQWDTINDFELPLIQWFCKNFSDLKVELCWKRNKSNFTVRFCPVATLTGTDTWSNNFLQRNETFVFDVWLGAFIIC